VLVKHAREGDEVVEKSFPLCRSFYWPQRTAYLGRQLVGEENNGNIISIKQLTSAKKSSRIYHVFTTNVCVFQRDLLLMLSGQKEKHKQKLNCQKFLQLK
jgi:hypothetical protein